jgi:hypothetical protein
MFKIGVFVDFFPATAAVEIPVAVKASQMSISVAELTPGQFFLASSYSFIAYSFVFQFQTVFIQDSIDNPGRLFVFVFRVFVTRFVFLSFWFSSSPIDSEFVQSKNKNLDK